MNQDITLEKLTDYANTVMVARLELEQYEKEKEEILAQNEAYQNLLLKIEEAKGLKEAAQRDFLLVLSDSGLKSLKTEQANFARVKRVTATVDSAYKKSVENELKAGREVMGWKLNETEYLSIKLN